MREPWSWLCLLAFALTPLRASGQTIESVGSRAQGMGGAFVAVADDSTATWWNPAALAAGPFLDATIGWARRDFRAHDEPVGRIRVSAVSVATPPLGVSYYRLRITDIQPVDPTVTPVAGRQDGRVEVVRSLRLNDLGVTLLASVFPGVHVGTTLKFLEGRVSRSTSDGSSTPGSAIDLGEDVAGGVSHGQFDADIGVLAVAGPIRVGGVVKNLRAPAFGDGSGTANGQIRVPRQARVGLAFDASQRRTASAPWMASVDVDVAAYATASGDRRVVAAGVERWLFGERIGIRGGGRFNQIGSKEQSATAGVSAAIRPGLFVDAHAVRGGSDDERGWGVGARVSF